MSCIARSSLLIALVFAAFQKGACQSSCASNVSTVMATIADLKDSVFKPNYRLLWCQSNLSAVTDAVTALGTNCNYTPSNPGIVDIQQICGPCGNGLDKVMNYSRILQGSASQPPDLPTCQAQLSDFQTGWNLINSTACSNSTMIQTMVASMANTVPTLLSFCNYLSYGPSGPGYVSSGPSSGPSISASSGPTMRLPTSRSCGSLSYQTFSFGQFVLDRLDQPNFRSPWCQANLSSLSSMLTMLANATCADSTANASLQEFQLLCGPCGDALDKLNDFDSLKGKLDAQTCPSKVTTVQAAWSVLNTSTCLTSSFVQFYAGEDRTPMYSIACNPCFLAYMNNVDAVSAAGCNVSSEERVAPDTATTVASMPLCVASLCPLKAACTTSAVQAMVASFPPAVLLANVTQYWLPSFSCSSVVTLTGKFSLSVADANAVKSSNKAKGAIAEGIANFLGLPVQASMIVVSFLTNRRLDFSRKLQQALQVGYTIALNSKDVSTVQTKMTQATAQALTPSINATLSAAVPAAGSVSVTSTSPPTTNNVGGTVSGSFRSMYFLGCFLHISMILF